MKFVFKAKGLFVGGSGNFPIKVGKDCGVETFTPSIHREGSEFQDELGKTWVVTREVLFSGHAYNHYSWEAEIVE